MVNWTTDKTPPETGTYLASIKIQWPHAQHVFYDAAYYDRDNQTWYKYDPFDPKYKPTEAIDGMVTGWCSDIGVHL